jgi:hypothetical protein
MVSPGEDRATLFPGLPGMGAPADVTLNELTCAPVRGNGLSPGRKACMHRAHNLIFCSASEIADARVCAATLCRGTFSAQQTSLEER